MTYNGRRGPHVSQYLLDLNTSGPQAASPGESFNIEDDLALFTNTEFFDFDSGQNTDFQAQGQPSGKSDGPSPGNVSSAAPSVMGDLPNLDFLPRKSLLCRLFQQCFRFLHVLSLPGSLACVASLVAWTRVCRSYLQAARGGARRSPRNYVTKLPLSSVSPSAIFVPPPRPLLYLFFGSASCLSHTAQLVLDDFSAILPKWGATLARRVALTNGGIAQYHVTSNFRTPHHLRTKPYSAAQRSSRSRVHCFKWRYAFTVYHSVSD